MVADPGVESGPKEISLDEAKQFQPAGRPRATSCCFQIFFDEKDQVRAEEQGRQVWGPAQAQTGPGKTFGRFAAQDRQAGYPAAGARRPKRDNVFKPVPRQEGELISGHRAALRTRQYLSVDLSGAEAVLPGARAGAARVVFGRVTASWAYVVDIDKSGARPRKSSFPVVTRACWRSSFEMEVPGNL